MTASVFYQSASELATLTNTFSVSGTATDPDTVTLTVVTPSGTSTNYTYALAEVSKTATGVYTKDVGCSESGRWTYVWTGTGAASDVAAGTWEVFSTTLSQLYASLEEIKDARRVTDTVDDAAFLSRITRASRAIDVHCLGQGNHFYLDSAASARIYRTAGNVNRARDGEVIVVDDIGSSSGLVVEVGDGTTWTAVTDYTVEPDNALARGRSATALRRTYGLWSTCLFVRVTALWGWPTVPANVKEATFLLANRRFMRRDSPEGVVGWADQGPVRISRYDSDIEDLLTPYAKDGFA